MSENNKKNNNINYETAGVSIETANDTKKEFKNLVSSKSLSHCKPINQVGAFASLIEIGLKDYNSPVFVLKSEEPGSKQMLSIDNNKIEWIARDLINHLINDIIVMGANPCAVLDTIICGKLEKDTVLKLVDEMSKACIENGCILVGGETSEQPGMLPSGRYVLQASVLGIADKEKIIDGQKIQDGDALIALASNGLHTNGYSLVRKLIDSKPEILDEKINGESFLDSILKPHTSYYSSVKIILENYYDSVTGMAHITGGSIYDNLIRVIQSDNLQANIDLSAIKIPKIFNVIKNYANMSDDDMLNNSPFNNGVGLIVVSSEKNADAIINLIKSTGTDAYRIGQVTKSSDDSGDKNKKDKKVALYNKLNWEA